MVETSIKKYIAEHLKNNKLEFYRFFQQRYPTTPEKDMPDFGPMMSMTSIPLSFPPG